MSDVPDPTHVARPKPNATWLIDADRDPRAWPDGFEVRRYTDTNKGETVSIRTARNTMWTTPAVAQQLSAAIAAAAEWTDDQLVSAEIIDDRPRIEHHLLVGAMLSIRPRWMSPDSAQDLGRDLVEWLYHQSRVVIVCDGREWTP